MKTPVFILLTTALLPALAPAQSFKEQLQQGLYSEEVNRDLTAAIESYKAVIDRYDADRKIAATALFRLAECVRKRGDEEAAADLYNRLLRDFSDQTQLTAPALAQLGEDASTAPGGSVRDIESSEIDNLRKAFADAPDLINSKAGDGLFPIEKFAASGQAEVVAYLLEAGAEPDRTAALHRAVLAGHKDVVTLLLGAGTDPARPARLLLQKSGQPVTVTPLHVAATTGNVAITSLLIEHKAPVDPQATAPLGGGSRSNPGRPRVVGQNDVHVGPLSNDRPHSTTPLHIAISNRFPALTDFLLANGADPALKNGHGQCSTHLAVRANEPGLLKLLIDKGAPVDAADNAGYTPLLHAAYANQTDLVELLIASGASPKSAASDGKNAAHFAVDNGNLALLETCVSHRVELDLVPEKSAPLLHYTIGTHLGTGLLRTLLDAGADPDIADSRSRRPIHIAAELNDTAAIALIAAAGAELEARFYGNTPLMLAASRQHAEATSALLKLGADVNARTQGGNTPLIVAASNKDGESPVEVATALVDAGAQVDATDSRGFSALHHAAANSNTPLVRYLLTAGADPLLRTEQYEWALELTNSTTTKSALFAPTRNAAIDLKTQIFSHAPGDTSWRIPHTRIQDGFGPYTLFELLLKVQDAAFTTATVIRVDPETRKEISRNKIDLTDALTNQKPEADIPLLWGDIVEYDRRTQFDPGLTPGQAEFLTAYMTRKIGLSIPYNPLADDPFAVDSVETTVIPARWVTGPDRKTMIPDFSKSYDPEKYELVGALTLSDAIEVITKHCDRKATTPTSLRREIPDASGKSRPVRLSNGNPDYPEAPLSGFHTLTPLRTGDAVEITLGADPLPKPNTGRPGRRVILPPSNR